MNNPVYIYIYIYTCCFLFYIRINFRGYNKGFHTSVEKVGFRQLVLTPCSNFQNRITGSKQNDPGGRAVSLSLICITRKHCLIRPDK
jgi:hypothetical protein